MQLKPTLRKATELGIGLTAIATLILAGCGGGGGGGSTSSGGGTAAATTTATVTPFKGPFYSGASVSLKDAEGNPVSLISGGTINASGVASVTYNANVHYPLIVEVTGNYYNENTGTAETTTIPIRGLIESASAASSVPVTVVTETAVADLETRLGSFAAAHPIQAASAVAALNAAGTMLGIPASAVPAFDPATHQTSDPDTLRLAAWAVVADGQTGATLAEKVKALANTLVANPASAPSAVVSQAAYNNALTAMTVGASSVMAAGATAPTPPTIPTSSYGTLYASAASVTTTLTTQQSACVASGGHWDFVNSICMPNPAIPGAVTGTGGATIPAAPVGVTATANSATQISINWTNVSGATAYNVYRSTAPNVQIVAGNNITPLLQPAAGPFGDTGLAAATTYYYKVTAVNAAGESVGSAEAAATTAAATAVGAVPAAPVGVQMGGARQGIALNLSASVSTMAGATLTAAPYGCKSGITTDGTNLYVADCHGKTIRKIVIATGVMSTMAGSGLVGTADGIGNAASFTAPTDITTDGTNLYVGDANRVRQVSIATGAVTTLAGSGMPAAWGVFPGYIDASTVAINGTGTTALFGWISGITTDGINLYVTDIGFNMVRKIVIATGAVSSFAAPLNSPVGITTDGTNLYITQSGIITNIQKVVIATGAVTTLAGAGFYASIDGIGTAAAFQSLGGLTTDGANLYVTENGQIRKVVIATGAVTTLAGTPGVMGLVDGIGAAASFADGFDITSDGTNLYVSDKTIRKIQ